MTSRCCHEITWPFCLVFNWKICHSLTNRHMVGSLALAWPAPNLPDLPQHGLERRQRDFCLRSLSWSDPFRAGCWGTASAT
ncbi:hypothetical protein DXT89_01235 [Agrobacterium vitis]|uniref:Uncharacterized protein n=1 Tax=Agrobacterium vitis TaxID=373 RepID=A0A368NYA6_AGRVI|nr:hypothetical protein DXM22_02490 [Agrobacterium vitis]KAA3532021.1 hypothetical protein DXT89_01235 [Agrobacterium vitis]RCU55146.1 hypothetical protein ASB66_009380 [Agrobacterium vitis]